MSLEQAMADLTAALKEHTALLKGGAANLAAKAGGTKPADKPADKPASKPADKAAASKPAAGNKKPKAPTEENLREKFGGYLSSVEDKAEKRRLTATVKPILEHFGVERVTEIPEEHRAEAIGYCDLLIAGFEEDGVDGAEAVDLELSNEEGDGEGEGDDGVL